MRSSHRRRPHLGALVAIASISSFAGGCSDLLGLGGYADTDTPCVQCGATCRDLQTDPLACGSCLTRCSLDAKCLGGACVCPESYPDDCNGRCTNTDADAHDCGGCGVECPIDATGKATCDRGNCAYCPSGQESCKGAGCVDKSSDPKNCGECGHACPIDATCIKGTCACPAGKGTCAGRCVDMSTDAMHCGGCDVACSSASECKAGSCTCVVAGATFCKGVSGCVDLASDPKNCASCGKQCPALSTCIGSACECPKGMNACAANCRDLRDDAAACGSCANVCNATQYCNGSGVCRCRPRLASCPDGCADLATDPSHCGSCSVRCAPGAVCTAGVCKPNGDSCKGFHKVCDTGGGAFGCVATTTDALNCGDCNVRCNSSQLCVGGACVDYAPAPTLCASCPCAACATVFPKAPSVQCCRALMGQKQPNCVAGSACPM